MFIFCTKIRNDISAGSKVESPRKIRGLFVVTGRGMVMHSI